MPSPRSLSNKSKKIKKLLKFSQFLEDAKFDENYKKLK